MTAEVSVPYSPAGKSVTIQGVFKRGSIMILGRVGGFLSHFHPYNHMWKAKRVWQVKDLCISAPSCGYCSAAGTEVNKDSTWIGYRCRHPNFHQGQFGLKYESTIWYRHTKGNIHQLCNAIVEWHDVPAIHTLQKILSHDLHTMPFRAGTWPRVERDCRLSSSGKPLNVSSCGVPALRSGSGHNVKYST